MFASALTTMLAFMPLWGLGGINGDMVVAMPAVVILALGVSVVESFTVLPACVRSVFSRRPMARSSLCWSMGFIRTSSDTRTAPSDGSSSV